MKKVLVMATICVAGLVSANTGEMEPGKGLKKAIVLTTQTAHWFVERGFEPIAISDLPIKKQQMYNYQRRSKVLMADLT